MEYLIALLAVVVTVVYAVTIAINIGRGRPWALQMAQAVSLINPNAPDFGRYQQIPDFDSVEVAAPRRANETVEPEQERLAA